VELEPLPSGDIDNDADNTTTISAELEAVTKDVTELSTSRVFYKVEDDAPLSSEVRGGEEDANVVAREGSNICGMEMTIDKLCIEAAGIIARKK